MVQSRRQQCVTPKNKKHLFPCTKNSNCIDKDGTKIKLKLKLTINRTSQYHKHRPWMSSLELFAQYALRKELWCQPTAVWMSHDMDTLYSKAEGNFSPDEFHGYAMSVTNHISRDNHVEKWAPTRLWCLWYINPQATRLLCNPNPSPNSTCIQISLCPEAATASPDQTLMCKAPRSKDTWMEYSSRILHQD